MLQIASGKLFSQNTVRCNRLRGTLYTNLKLPGASTIETAAGSLLPTSSLANDLTLVYELTEFVEGEPAPGVVASYGIAPYLDEFGAVVSFVLRVTCTSDHDLTSRLTGGRGGPLSNTTSHNLVRQVFDRQVFCGPQDVQLLTEVARDLIGLKRASYLAAMRAIRTYVTGLHRIADDTALAYTLLVASVESLVQDFDGFQGEWQDYSEDKRRAIDAALSGANDETQRLVRETLLRLDQIALGRRFRDFTIKHLERSFFREEAKDENNPLGRAELRGVLQQAYSLRSKYVHELVELPRLLTLPASYSETLLIDRHTYLTFQGLARLARHVILKFIESQPKVEKEEYDYSLERAGIVQVRLSPEYWIGDGNNVTTSGGRARLEGILQQAETYFRTGDDGKITDMRGVLAEVEKMMPSMRRNERLPFLALYLIFNGLVPAHMQTENLAKIQKQYASDVGQPSPEAMLMHLILGTNPNWSLDEHKATHDNFFSNYHTPSSLKIPHTLAAGLSLNLAERYRSAEYIIEARELIAAAVENHPGHGPLYTLLEIFDAQEELNWRSVVF